jgi:hypothetical protein
MVEVTDRAREVIRRALEAARRFQSEAVIRVIGAPDGVLAILAEEPEPDDEALGDGAFAAAGLAGTLDAGEHDRLELR